MTGEDYKTFFRRLASGVCVVTFSTESGVHGFTATSVTSVCASPPVALFCICRQNESYRHVGVGRLVGISILGREQKHLSERFAAKAGREGYGRIETICMPRGVPTLRGALAQMEGSIIDIRLVGDHAIVLVNFEAAWAASDDVPIVYFDHGYYNPTPI